eukprot:4764874-Heterocapsa_arctica.AAC.1
MSTRKAKAVAAARVKETIRRKPRNQVGGTRVVTGPGPSLRERKRPVRRPGKSRKSLWFTTPTASWSKQSGRRKCQQKTDQEKELQEKTHWEPDRRNADLAARKQQWHSAK